MYYLKPVFVRANSRRLAHACASLSLALVGPAAFGAKVQAAPPTYLCPGNFLTNQLDPAQAQAQKCTLAGAGRLSQASLASPAPVAPVAKTPASAAAPAPSSVAPATRAPAAPAAPVARRAEPGITPREDVAAQRARDSDARAILQSELTRTLVQMQALSAKADASPETRAALDRLRADEAALRREIARLPI